MSCRHFATYTNGYGHEVCSDCGRVIETTASDSTKTPKRMKPLDEFQIKMFKAISGMDIHDAWDKIPHERFLSMERGAIAAAQVAKDLARRASDFALGEVIVFVSEEDKAHVLKEFLESEGITE